MQWKKKAKTINLAINKIFYTRTTIEQLANEFNTLDTKIKKIKGQIQLSSTERDIQEQMAQFLQVRNINLNKYHDTWDKEKRKWLKYT